MPSKFMASKPHSPAFEHDLVKDQVPSVNGHDPMSMSPTCKSQSPVVSSDLLPVSIKQNKQGETRDEEVVKTWYFLHLFPFYGPAAALP